MSDTLQPFLDQNQANFVRLAEDIKEALHAGPRRWLGIREAAAYAGLSERSIKSLLSSGKLAAHRPVRGRVLIDRRELDSTIESSTGRIRKGRGVRQGEKS